MSSTSQKLNSSNKDYGLIVESDASFNMFTAINESSADLPEGILMRLHGTFIPMDIPGTNGRWYTYDEYKPHVESLMPKIQRKELFGEIEHPQRVSVPYDLVSHRIDEVYYDKDSNSWKGTISILDTEKGRHLYNIARTGAPLYVSHRALGSMDKQTAKGIILKLITWDVTSIPSFNVAEFNKAVPINESAYNFIPLQGDFLNEAVASINVNESLEDTFDTSGCSRKELSGFLNELDSADISYTYDGSKDILSLDTSELTKSQLAMLNALAAKSLDEAAKIYNIEIESADLDEVKRILATARESMPFVVFTTNDAAKYAIVFKYQYDVNNAIDMLKKSKNKPWFSKIEYQPKDDAIVVERITESVKYSDDLVKAAIAYTTGKTLEQITKLSNEANQYSYQIKGSSKFDTITYDEVNSIIDLHKDALIKQFDLNESDDSTEVKEGMSFEHDDKQWKVVSVGKESSKCKSGKDEQDIDNSVILENCKDKSKEDDFVDESTKLPEVGTKFKYIGDGDDKNKIYTVTEPGLRKSNEKLAADEVYLSAPGSIGFDISVNSDTFKKDFVAVDSLNESIAVEPSQIVDDIKSRKYITIQEYAKEYKYKDEALHPDDLFNGAIALAKEGLLYNADAIENKDEPEIAAVLTAQQTADMLGALLAEEQADLNESSIDAFTKGDILKLKDDITLISLKELMNKELKFVEYVKSGLISQPLFAKVKVDNAFHEINPEYLTKFMNESILSWLKDKYNAIKRWANSSDTPLFTVEGQDYIVDEIKPEGEVVAIDNSGNKKTFTFDEVDKFINDCTNSKTKKNMINENNELQSLLDVLKSKKFVSKDENANEYDYNIVDNGFLAMTADIAVNIAAALKAEGFAIAVNDNLVEVNFANESANTFKAGDKVVIHNNETGVVIYSTDKETKVKLDWSGNSDIVKTSTVKFVNESLDNTTYGHVELFITTTYLDVLCQNGRIWANTPDLISALAAKFNKIKVTAGDVRQIQFNTELPRIDSKDYTAISTKLAKLTGGKSDGSSVVFKNISANKLISLMPIVDTFIYNSLSNGFANESNQFNTAKEHFNYLQANNTDDLLLKAYGHPGAELDINKTYDEQSYKAKQQIDKHFAYKTKKFVANSNGFFVNESVDVQVGQKYKGTDGVTKNKVGVVTKVQNDMATIDFGNGDTYGIMLSRIEAGEFEFVNESAKYKKGDRVLFILDNPDADGWGKLKNGNQVVGVVQYCGDDSVDVIIENSGIKDEYTVILDDVDLFVNESTSFNVTDFKPGLEVKVGNKIGTIVSNLPNDNDEISIDFDGKVEWIDIDKVMLNESFYTNLKSHKNLFAKVADVITTTKDMSDVELANMLEFMAKHIRTNGLNSVLTAINESTDNEFNDAKEHFDSLVNSGDIDKLMTAYGHPGSDIQTGKTFDKQSAKAKEQIVKHFEYKTSKNKYKATDNGFVNESAKYESIDWYGKTMLIKDKNDLATFEHVFDNDSLKLKKAYEGKITKMDKEIAEKLVKNFVNESSKISKAKADKMSIKEMAKMLAKDEDFLRDTADADGGEYTAEELLNDYSEDDIKEFFYDTFVNESESTDVTATGNETVIVSDSDKSLPVQLATEFMNLTDKEITFEDWIQSKALDNDLIDNKTIVETKTAVNKLLTEQVINESAALTAKFVNESNQMLNESVELGLIREHIPTSHSYMLSQLNESALFVLEQQAKMYSLNESNIHEFIDTRDWQAIANASLNESAAIAVINSNISATNRSNRLMASLRAGKI